MTKNDIKKKVENARRFGRAVFPDEYQLLYFGGNDSLSWQVRNKNGDIILTTRTPGKYFMERLFFMFL